MYILTTAGDCDCGTVLGRLSYSSESESTSYKNDIKKLRKQGWSETKIQRWVSEKEQLQEKSARKNTDLTEKGSAEASYWVPFISAILKSGFT